MDDFTEYFDQGKVRKLFKRSARRKVGETNLMVIRK